MSELTLGKVQMLCTAMGGEFKGYFTLPRPKTGMSGKIAFEMLHEGVTYWVGITREFFHTFSKQYPKEPEGEGISQEVALLKHAVKKNPDSVILIVLENLTFFAYPAKLWLGYATLHKTISDFTDKETGTLASIPKEFLKRWYPNETFDFKKFYPTSGQLQLG